MGQLVIHKGGGEGREDFFYEDDKCMTLCSKQLSRTGHALIGFHPKLILSHLLQ